MTAVEKFALSPAVTIAARLAMFLTPIVVSIGLFIIGNYLTGQTQAMTAIVERQTRYEESAAAVATRVTTIEAHINMGQQQREEFQKRTEIVLDDLRRQNTAILQAIARLEARNAP